MKKKITAKKESAFRSIRFKINLAVAICGVILMIFSLWLLSDSMKYVEKDLMSDRLASDMSCLRSELEEAYGSGWSMREDTLYLGETSLGNGSSDNARDDIFIRCNGVSGTYYYAFVLDSRSTSVPESDDLPPYVLASCSAASSNRRALDGTVLDGNTVQALYKSADGVWSGKTNMGGMAVWCRYELVKDSEGRPVAVIAACRNVSETRKITEKQNIRGFILISVVMIIISLSLGGIVFTMLGAIKKIRERLAVIGSGDFSSDPLKLDTHDELSDVADSVNEMAASLKEGERIGAELSLATDIQAHMLPSIFPAFPEHNEFDIYATMNPAKEVGGDFYDFFMLDDRHLAVVIADVSGKGIPAALFMVIAKTLIKNHTQMGMSPAEVFTKVNQMLCEGNEAELFVTAWMGVLDLENGTLTYVNAGHNAPLIRLGDGKYEFLRSKPAFVLAGLEGIRYKQNTLTMQPGSKLFLYTDGVTESTRAGCKLYGDERLAAYLNAHAGDGAKDTIKGLHEDIAAFVGNDDQFDDITMLALTYQSKATAENVIEREFEASDTVLSDVIGFVEGELEKLDCPPKTAMQITLAVEEIFVNIAHYAYDRQRQTMSLGFIPEEDGSVSLRFSDRGLPFDPLSNKDPDITLSAEERGTGGLGIFMVKKIMDDVEYKFENGKNILTINKKL